MADVTYIISDYPRNTGHRESVRQAYWGSWSGYTMILQLI
jgi:hypothetical protein